MQYHKLVVYQRAVQYDEAALPLIARVRRKDPSLADHLTRSGNSLLTSIAEGASADQSKMKATSYRNGKREAEEGAMCWEKAARYGWAERTAVLRAIALLEEVARMLGAMIIRFDRRAPDGT